ncbi:hypothetical protein IDJ81_07120 [Tsuneonella flava]|uniref:Uncharacterized protein n=1 Tax=Tsuneonella flava TaxID=2055955 RepID=A0ABX7KCU2_9SPHN|nr:hypothetical protein [Tsuneonella flava]QSB45844.1 hypothetical protein IDJ81_07120 [Tsuneonella flava]
MKYDLLIKVQTHADLTSWTVGEKILSPLFEDGRLVPERAATFGEVSASHGFDVDGIMECRAHWASQAVMRANGTSDVFPEDFHWRRRKVAKSQGYVSFAETNARGKKIPARVLLQSQYRKEIDWAGLFVNWCDIATPFAAILHPLTAQDSPRKNNKDVGNYSYDEDVYQQAWSRFLGGEFYCEFRAGELNSLVSGLTNLGWGSFFGGDFSTEVDEAKIVAAGFPVRKIGDGYLVQVTENISDVLDDFALFSKRRAELKSLFRDGLFMIKDEPTAS